LNKIIGGQTFQLVIIACGNFLLTFSTEFLKLNSFKYSDKNKKTPRVEVAISVWSNAKEMKGYSFVLLETARQIAGAKFIYQR